MPAPKGKKHNKPTKAKQQQILQLVIKLLSSGRKAGEIKRAISEQYKLSPRTVEGYIRRAREEMRSETGKSIEDLRSESNYFYLSILSDPTASHRDKLKARELIDKLLGLPKPVMVHNKNLNLEITPEDIQGMSDDELADLKSRLTDSD